MVVFVIGQNLPLSYREMNGQRRFRIVGNGSLIALGASRPLFEEGVLLRQLFGNSLYNGSRNQFGHYGHGLFDGSDERHIRCQEHGRQHFFAATPFALCIQTQGSAIHPFPVGKGEGIGNRFSRLVVCRDRFPLSFHSFFSPLNNLCRAAAVLQWWKHSMLPVFPIQ